MTKTEEKSRARKKRARYKTAMTMFGAYEQAFVIAEQLVHSDKTIPIDMDTMWKVHAMLRAYCHSLEETEEA